MTPTLGHHLTAQDKRDLLRTYGRRYGLRTLVETGLYRGYGSGMSVTDAFDRYVVIDCQPRNVQVARAVGFDARLGDSARLLPSVLNELGGPALFWLDAHGVKSDFPGFPDFPTMNELRAIAFWRHGPNSVVLVDDLGMFGAESWQPLIGAPELDLLCRFVDTFGFWEREERDETMRLTPKAQSVSESTEADRIDEQMQRAGGAPDERASGLPPCPFCGGELCAVTLADYGPGVSCSGCGAYTSRLPWHEPWLYEGSQ